MWSPKESLNTNRLLGVLCGIRLIRSESINTGYDGSQRLLRAFDDQTWESWKSASKELSRKQMKIRFRFEHNDVVVACGACSLNGMCFLHVRQIIITITLPTYIYIYTSVYYVSVVIITSCPCAIGAGLNGHLCTWEAHWPKPESLSIAIIRLALGVWVRKGMKSRAI